MSIKDKIVQKFAESIAEIKDGTVCVTNFSGYEKYGNLLGSELNSDERLKAMNEKMLRYFTIDDLAKIAVSFKLDENYSYERMMGELNQRTQIISSDVNAINKYTVYFPLYFILDKQINKCSYDGLDIDILTYEDISSFLTEKYLEECDEPGKNVLMKCNYLSVKIKARSKTYAIRQAEAAINLLRCILAYYICYRRDSITFGGTQNHSLIKFNLSYCFVFNGTQYDGKTKYENGPGKRVEFLPEKIRNDYVVEFINNYNLAYPELKKVIRDTMHSYYYGLIEDKLSYSFLSFWTAIEKISLKSKTIKEFEITAILKGTLKNPSSIHEHEIDRLYKMRNKIVHEGDYFNTSQSDRNMIKSYAEYLVDFFIRNLCSFQKNKIEKIYKFIQDDNEKLLLDKEIIDCVIELRSKMN